MASGPDALRLPSARKTMLSSSMVNGRAEDGISSNGGEKGLVSSSGAFHTWLARYSANVSARAAFQTNFPLVLMRLVGVGRKSLRKVRAVCHCCMAEP